MAPNQNLKKFEHVEKSDQNFFGDYFNQLAGQRIVNNFVSTEKEVVIPPTEMKALFMPDVLQK